MSDIRTPGYLHGFSPEEQARLRRQARITEHLIHEGLPFRRVRTMLEVGCGVGAQTEILLRRWPDMKVIGIDANGVNLDAAREYLTGLSWARERWELVQADAGQLEIEPGLCDGAWLCWILEHVPEPARVLSEVRRVLRPGSPIVCNEVQNATFFLSPYSPATIAYWSAFTDHQWNLGGDPFVGAKLGNLLQQVGFRDVQTDVRPILLDNRAPTERAEFIEFWTDLLLSGSPALLEADRVTAEQVEAMTGELTRVAHDPDAVFFFAFVQARARVD